MTPEEIIEKLEIHCADKVKRAVEFCVAAERERCARIAASERVNAPDDSWIECAHTIEDRIRASETTVE